MPRTPTKRSTSAFVRLDIRTVLGSMKTVSVTLSNASGPGITIEVVRTPCHFGGSRTWWLCPRCGNRFAVLWGNSAGFACRHCQRLNYASTRVAASNKPFRRANKIRARLGWGGGVAHDLGDKPKGMHWRTYLRLMTELNRHSIAAMQSTDKLAKRLTVKLAGIGGMYGG